MKTKRNTTKRMPRAARIPTTGEWVSSGKSYVPPGPEWDAGIIIHCNGLLYRPSMDLGKFIRKVLKDPMDPLKRATPNAPAGAAPR